MSKKNTRKPVVHMTLADKDKFADAIADQAVTAINEHRKAKGLPPLIEERSSIKEKS